MTVKAIPEGYTTVTPWMISKDTDALMDYLTRAFGAEEISRLVDENGVVGDRVGRVRDPADNSTGSRPGSRTSRRKSC